MEDTVNANTSASSPTMDKNDTECRTVSNNNSWGSWGSWISSAKTKVNIPTDKSFELQFKCNEFCV